ncbi:MAG: hypothetical protein ACOCZV_02445, partial [Nanoarchaeota archaeon]
MKVEERKLREKGWSEKEIQHAKQILTAAEKTKHPHMEALEKATYWMLLVIIIIGAIAIPWLMEPLLIVMTKAQAIISFAITGAMFGTLASILIQDIEHARHHHHAIVGITIPIVAIVSSVTIVANVNSLKDIFTNIANYNPYILAIVFGVTALIPYTIMVYIRHKRDNDHGTGRMDDTPYQVQGL